MSKKKQPIYLRAVRLVDPATGAEVSAMVPAGAADYEQLREKGVKIGGMYRADLTRPRNYEFHKLAHRLSDLVRRNIDTYQGLGAHEALKKLQEEARVECEVTYTEIPGIGTLRSVKARSIAFDAMDQPAFFQMIRSICEHIVKVHWPQCTPEEVEEMIKVMPEQT